MKKIIPFVFIFILFSCYADQKEKRTDKNSSSIASSYKSDTSIFFPIKQNDKIIDTLFVKNIGPGLSDYGIIWKKDTIVKELYYGEMYKFIKPIDTLQFQNIFLLCSNYSGDGCPCLYKLLAFKNETTYFLSDYFGNCNDIDSINYDHSKINFFFNSESDTGRIKMKFAYDRLQYQLSEQLGSN